LELSFEYTGTLGTGASPQAVHMMDNGLRFFYLDGGVVKAKEAYPDMGIYDDLVFADKGRACTNTGVEKPQLKKVAHHGAYGFWSAGNAHRFVMYMLPSDISVMVESISISHTKDSPISQLSATFQNVENRLVGRARSIVQPNTRLELYFSMGSSDEIGMGRFYIDRTNVDYPKGMVSVSARNTIGKLLKDQTFDEDTTFTESDLKLNLEAVLALASVEENFVGDPAKTWNLTFEPDVTILDGLTQLIALLSGWQIKETMDGVVGIASSADTRFDQPTTVAFEREKTCWSYSTEYADENTYAKICVRCSDPEQVLYVTLDPHRWWNSPGNKTLYVDLPDGTSSTELAAYAAELAAGVALVGRTESFAGIFTPALIVGDVIALVENDGTQTEIGTVTTVKHTLGRSGFYTEFTIDSSGRKGKALLKDYLSQITSTSASKDVTIT